MACCSPGLIMMCCPPAKPGAIWPKLLPPCLQWIYYIYSLSLSSRLLFLLEHLGDNGKVLPAGGEVESRSVWQTAHHLSLLHCMNILKLISTNLNASYTTFKQECLTNISACCTACNSTQTPALPAQCTLTVHTQAGALDATVHSNCICAPTWHTFKTSTCSACTLKAQCAVCRHKHINITHSNLRQFITCMFIYSLLDGCIVYIVHSLLANFAWMEALIQTWCLFARTRRCLATVDKLQTLKLNQTVQNAVMSWWCYAIQWSKASGQESVQTKQRLVDVQLARLTKVQFIDLRCSEIPCSLVRIRSAVDTHICCPMCLCSEAWSVWTFQPGLCISYMYTLSGYRTRQ